MVSVTAASAGIAAESLHACLGVRTLGQCHYNPAIPTVYFSLGDAVAALAFTLTVAQLLKPIYRFRLQARSLREEALYGLVFLGVAAAVVAAILPNIPVGADLPFEYPILWELLSVVLFVSAYGLVVFSILRPVTLKPKRMKPFVISAGRFLAAEGSSVEDLRDFARELSKNVPALIKMAAFLDDSPRDNAFFDFIYRDRLYNAANARSLLMLMADSALCETLVSTAPWSAATMLQAIAKDHLHSRSAEPLIREIGKQAIVSDQSMIERERGFYGFGTAPLLSDSLFGSAPLLRMYDPLDQFRFMAGKDITPAILRRFNSAAERAVKELIESGSIWDAQSAFSVQDYLESVFMFIWGERRSGRYDGELTLAVLESVKNAIEMSDKLLGSANEHTRVALYQKTENDHDFHLLEHLSEIVFNALSFVSFGFKGPDDDMWILAIEIFQSVFPSIGSIEDGITPFQQRLSIKILKKLSENMNGFYPPISRILFSCIGPYETKVSPGERTAFGMLRAGMYAELTRFVDLVVHKPSSWSDFLPENVAYDREANKFTHTYRGGTTAETDMTAIKVAAPLLFDPAVRSVAPSR